MRRSATSTLGRQAAPRGETPTCRNPTARVGKLEVPQVPALPFRMVPLVAAVQEPPVRGLKRKFSNRWRMMPDNRDAQPKTDGGTRSQPAHAWKRHQGCRLCIAMHNQAPLRHAAAEL